MQRSTIVTQNIFINSRIICVLRFVLVFGHLCVLLYFSLLFVCDSQIAGPCQCTRAADILAGACPLSDGVGYSIHDWTAGIQIQVAGK